MSVLGEVAAWATPMPAALSLFPGADGTVTIQFQPPRSAQIRAGSCDFAVRVAATQNSDDSVVEEGSVTIEPFVDISARITPRTSEAKRTTRHVVSVENRGNAPVSVDISALDPDEALAFAPEPATLTIEPGDTDASSIKVVARKGFARGPAQHRPFQAHVTASGSTQPPVLLDATFVQKAGLPKFVPVLIGAAVILAVAAVMLPALGKKDGGGGLFSLTNTGGATTTLPGEGGAGGEEAIAEAEAEAAVEAAAAGGGASSGAAADGSTSGAATGGAATAAAGGAVAGGTATTAKTTDDSPGTTVADAKPVSTTTAPPAGGGGTASPTTTAPPTTTTAPPPYRSFLGTWTGSGACISISEGKGVLTISGAANGVDVSGSASIDDANTSNDFTSSPTRSLKARDYYQLKSTTLFVTTNSNISPSTASLTKTRFGCTTDTRTFSP